MPDLAGFFEVPYDAFAGRFLGVDPVTTDANNGASFNRYAYAANNPYKYLDPDGRAVETVFDAASLALSVAIYKSDPSFLNGLGVAIDGIAVAVPFVPGGLGVIRTVGRSAEGVKAGSEAAQSSSRAARREAMRKEGIPTSQQPISQSKNSSGREYQYETPKSGGGTDVKSVQQQTMDSSHPGEHHWEAGSVKTDPLTGQVRETAHGRPKIINDKSKVNYYE